uniref:Uncharacterized protein n=1 Tax=Strigops habroptila TaxID=2489341 RepID=A0A672TIL0_STRHB
DQVKAAISVATHCRALLLPLHQRSSDSARKTGRAKPAENYCYRKERAFCCCSSVNWHSAGSEEHKCQHKWRGKNTQLKAITVQAVLLTFNTKSTLELRLQTLNRILTLKKKKNKKKKKKKKKKKNLH